MKTWRDFVKLAGAAASVGSGGRLMPVTMPKVEPFKYMNADGSMWRVPKGKTVSHVVQEHNRAFPHQKITADRVLTYVPGGDPRRVRADTWYRMPGAFSAGMKRFVEWGMANGQRVE